MRAAPACQVSLKRFGVWRGAVLTLTFLGLTSIAAWLSTHERAADTSILVSALLAAIALVALAASLVQTQPVALRWDGRAWHLGQHAGDPMPGDLRVAIDLGPWMLLRFAPAAFGARPGIIWLPLQRRGLEAEWHALRCAVYSPRPPVADEPVEF